MGERDGTEGHACDARRRCAEAVSRSSVSKQYAEADASARRGIRTAARRGRAAPPHRAARG
ncbi:hypothetical protein EGT59_23130 [Burkholderia mallei]|nr:hypothetical protein EGT59_23130 [Burkholderia mallei]